MQGMDRQQRVLEMQILSWGANITATLHTSCRTSEKFTIPHVHLHGTIANGGITAHGSSQDLDRSNEMQ
jgi:hypothetical protein